MSSGNAGSVEPEHIDMLTILAEAELLAKDASVVAAIAAAFQHRAGLDTGGDEVRKAMIAIISIRTQLLKEVIRPLKAFSNKHL